MNEGEGKKKKIYKKGDVVTFRLLKKQRIGEEVLNMLNEANEQDCLNIEIIEALKLYTKFKKYNSAHIGESLTHNEAKFFEDECEEDIFERDKIKEVSYVSTNQQEEEEQNISKVIAIDWNQDDIDEAADELFSEDKDENKEKNKLNKAFKSLRRNFP